MKNFFSNYIGEICIAIAIAMFATAFFLGEKKSEKQREQITTFQINGCTVHSFHDGTSQVRVSPNCSVSGR